MRFETLAIHAGQKPDPAYGAVMTPIYQTSTFAFKGVNQPGKFDYSRSGNPTRKALEDCLAAEWGYLRIPTIPPSCSEGRRPVFPKESAL